MSLTIETKKKTFALNLWWAINFFFSQQDGWWSVVLPLTGRNFVTQFSSIFSLRSAGKPRGVHGSRDPRGGGRVHPRVLWRGRGPGARGLLVVQRRWAQPRKYAGLYGACYEVSSYLFLFRPKDLKYLWILQESDWRIHMSHFKHSRDAEAICHCGHPTQTFMWDFPLINLLRCSM